MDHQTGVRAQEKICRRHVTDLVTAHQRGEGKDGRRVFGGFALDGIDEEGNPHCGSYAVIKSMGERPDETLRSRSAAPSRERKRGSIRAGFRRPRLSSSCMTGK